MKSLLLSVVCVAAMASCTGGVDRYETCEVAEADTAQIVIDNIMSRRSVRAYKEQPVEREKLELVAKCGINAPSAINKQPWALRIVDDPAFISGVTEVLKSVNPKQAAEPGFKNAFRNAPAFIAVMTPKDDSGAYDCGLLTENMLLSARALGLGTCVLGSTARFMSSEPGVSEYVKRLDIPEGYKIQVIVAIGYPDESPAAKPRNEDVIRFVD